MPVYRIYIPGGEGHAPYERTFPCADDESAEAEALSFTDGRDAELWKAGRMIGRFRQIVPKKLRPSGAQRAINEVDAE
jgi:hypothetical protein